MNMLRVPLWGKVLPLILAGAGLAVIVGGAGITGDQPIKVQEPITFSTAANATEILSGNDAVIYNDDTSMTVNAETYPGDSHVVKLGIVNNSEVTQAQRLFVDAPEGFRFTGEVCGGTNGQGCTPGGTEMTVAQEDSKSFVYTATLDADGADADSHLYIVVETLPQVVPGYYNWSFHTESLTTTTNFD